MAKKLLALIILATLGLGCGDAGGGTSRETTLAGAGGSAGEGGHGGEGSHGGDGTGGTAGIEPLDIETVPCPGVEAIHTGEYEYTGTTMHIEVEYPPPAVPEIGIRTTVTLDYESLLYEGDPQMVRYCARTIFEDGLIVEEQTECTDQPATTYLNERGKVNLNCAHLIWEAAPTSGGNPYGITKPEGMLVGYAEILW